MPREQIRLLALDGGGVRGLSSLLILRRLMATVDPESPPKPCECFDMIGGTSTGGLIAIMLGRLRMTVDECIEAYMSLLDKVFETKSYQAKMDGELKVRFDSVKLADNIKRILRARHLDEDELLKDVDGSCKVFVCATSKQNSDTSCLTSYRSPRSENLHLLNSTTIWQAGLATFAATVFFDPVTIGPFSEEFVDGPLGANNPIYILWNEAQNVWGDQLQSKLQCVLSIGTGVPKLKPVPETRTIRIDLETETERTAQQFHRDKSSLDDEGRYYRFNVDRGLEEIDLEESKKKKDIAAATMLYLESRTVFKQIQACANNLAGRVYYGPYRTVFSLKGVPVSKHFVDRPSDTADIERSLLPRRLHFRREQRRKIFVLHGLGGIGKTELAANFARRHQATFSSVFWLDGRSEDRLRRSLADCASRIPNGQLPNRGWKGVPSNEDDLNIVVADALDWLALPDNTDWLLIFDGVDQDHEQGGTTGVFDVQKYLPGDHGSALLTTKLSQLARIGDAKQVKKVDKDLSKAIFELWYGGELVINETCKELLGLLDGLPLALTQAASYCRQTGLDITAYVRLYKQQWDDLMTSDTKSGSLLMDYDQRSFGTTWTVSFRAIESKSKSAANLLRLWAFIANKDLWYGLLRAAVFNQEQWPEWLYEIACNEVKFLDTVKLLVRYSMIEVQESEQGSYILHPVVHRWLSHIQDSSERAEFLRLAITVLGLSVSIQTPRDYWVLQRRLLPHIETCSWWMEYKHALRWNLDDMLVIDSIYNLGVVYKDQGYLPEAEVMYRRALLGREKALGLGHTSTLDTVDSLGDLYKGQGRLDEAEAMLQRALLGKEKALGMDHPSTLGTVNNLGDLYKDQGRLDEADAMLQRALRGYEKALGMDHPSTLETVNNLGLLYKDQGRLDEAEDMLQRALLGKEKALGMDHPSTLGTVNNFGDLYKDQGRLDEAESMLQRALQGYEKAFGPDHTSTFGTVDNLSTLYMAQGRLPKAEVLLHQALRGKEKALGSNHPSTLNTVNNLGLLFKDQGRSAEAEAMLQQALRGYERALGLDHTLTLGTVNNLGLLYKDQGRLDEAEAMLQQALRGKEKALGMDHPSTLETADNLGCLYWDQDRLSEAEAMFQRALQGKRKALGPYHRSTLFTVKNIRRLYTCRAEDGDSESIASEFTNSDWLGQESSTRPSSLSHGASTDGEQATQIRESFTFSRYKESAFEQETHKEEDDIQSVVSASDDIGSLAESRSGTAIHWQAAVDSFVSMLASNLELLALFQEATTKMQRARFVRNHQRLLKHFYVALSSERHTPSQQSAVEFLRLRRRRAYISNGIWSLVQPSDSTVMEKITLLNKRDKDQKIYIDRYLQAQDSAVHSAVTDTADTPILVLDHADSCSESSESTAGDDDESSDEDEAENQEDHALSKLQATADFLSSGQPFILYKEKLREFLQSKPGAVDLQDQREPVESRETNSSTAIPKEADNQREEAPVGRVHRAEETTRFPRPLSTLINSVFSMLSFPFSEPPVPPGKTRIRWKCRCGEALFDDFVEVEPGALQALQTRLRELNETESVDQEDHYSLRDHLKIIRQRLHASVTWIYRQALVKIGGTANEGNSALPLHSRNVDPQIDPAHSPEILHILMCIDKGEFWTRLYQQRLPSFNEDRDFFQFLREQYKEHRRLASRFTLRGVSTLSLARFTVDNNSFANVHNHERGCEPACVCIPPPEMIDSNEYQCRPAPKVQPGVNPAIGSNQLTHYFLKPHAFELPQRIIFDQLPKRACGQLALSPNEAQLGWGIHFKESWDWNAIYFVIVVLLTTGALLFGFVWATMKHDVPGAFAITASWMALGPMLLGYIAARNGS